MVLQLRNAQNKLRAFHEEYGALLTEKNQMKYATEDMETKLQMRKNAILSLEDKKTLIERQIKRLNRTYI